MIAASVSPLGRKDIFLATAVALVTFFVHATSPNATPFDSRWSVHTAMSILLHGDTDLNEYSAQIEKSDFYKIECVGPDKTRLFPVNRQEDCEGGKYHSFYPAAVSFLATPVVAVMYGVVHAAAPLLSPLADRMPTATRSALLQGDFIASSAAVEVLVASLLMGVTAGLFYLCCRFVAAPALAVAVALLFSFGSPAWSLASRALWQHGPSMLMLTAALLILLAAENDSRRIRYLGIPLALAFFCRPTNALPAVILTVFVWRHYRRHFPAFLLGTLPVIACLAIYAFTVYGTPIEPYLMPQRVNEPDITIHAALLEALTANLVSPARGLFVYVPLALASVAGMFLTSLSGQARRLRPYLAAIIAGHWLLVSGFETWWGGHGYGPRYMSDVTPLVFWFLVPMMVFLTRTEKRRRYWLAPLLVLLAGASITIHYRGAFHWAAYEWNTQPVNVDEAPWRVWDWRDPAFLR